MNVVAVLPEHEDSMPVVEGSVDISLDSIIEEKREEEASDDLPGEEFYRRKTGDNPTYFVEVLVSDWMPWIELQGERVTNEIPDNDYLIHSLRAPEELEYLRESLDDIVVIADQKAGEGFVNLADITVGFQSAGRKRRAIRCLIDEFSGNEGD